MIFIDLYRYAETLDFDYIPFDALSHFVVTEHERVGSLQLYPCYLNEDVSLGHTVLTPEKVLQNGQLLDAVQIRYSKNLNDCESRFVWSKELMHVFDSQEAAVDTSDKFFELLLELENRPLHADASAMLISEDDAEWMAILVLCPLKMRNKHFDSLQAGRSKIEDIAGILRIPDWAARHAMSPYYETAFRRLIGISATGPRRKKTAPEG